MKREISFDYFNSPLGRILLAADGDELAGVWFDGQRYFPQVDADWRQRRDVPVLRQASSELDEYFAGNRKTFDVKLARTGTAFQHEIWKAITSVSYGETTAYRDLAEHIGKPRAIRAAGAATGRNPWSIIVPCHRIVGADGSLTGYAGGLDRKQKLLALERRGGAASMMRRAA